jgi:hypothetical protein
MIAAQARVPVIPVWVGNTFEPRRTLFRRIPIEVRFGTPIEFESEGPPTDRRERYAEMTRRIMLEIARLGGEELVGEVSGPGNGHGSGPVSGPDNGPGSGGPAHSERVDLVDPVADPEAQAPAR